MHSRARFTRSVLSRFTPSFALYLLCSSLLSVPTSIFFTLISRVVRQLLISASASQSNAPKRSSSVLCLSSHYPFSCPFIAPLNQSLNRSIDSTRLDSDQLLLLSAGSEFHCIMSASASFGETKRSRAAPTSARRVGAPMNDCTSALLERFVYRGFIYAHCRCTSAAAAASASASASMPSRSRSLLICYAIYRRARCTARHGMYSAVDAALFHILPVLHSVAVCSMSSCLTVASGERLRSTTRSSSSYRYD